MLISPPNPVIVQKVEEIMSDIELDNMKAKFMNPWYVALLSMLYDPSSSADSSCAPVSVNTTFLTREEMPWLLTWQQIIKSLFT